MKSDLLWLKEKCDNETFIKNNKNFEKLYNFKHNCVYNILKIKKVFNCNKDKINIFINSMLELKFLKPYENSYKFNRNFSQIVPLSYYRNDLNSYVDNIINHNIIYNCLRNSDKNTAKELFKNIRKNKHLFLETLNKYLNNDIVFKNLYRWDFNFMVDKKFKLHIMNFDNADMVFKLKNKSRFYYFENNLNYVFSVFIGIALIKTIKDLFKNTLTEPIFIVQNDFLDLNHIDAFNYTANIKYFTKDEIQFLKNIKKFFNFEILTFNNNLEIKKI